MIKSRVIADYIDRNLWGASLSLKIEFCYLDLSIIRLIYRSQLDDHSNTSCHLIEK